MIPPAFPGDKPDRLKAEPLKNVFDGHKGYVQWKKDLEYWELTSTALDSRQFAPAILAAVAAHVKKLLLTELKEQELDVTSAGAYEFIKDRLDYHYGQHPATKQILATDRLLRCMNDRGD